MFLTLFDDTRAKLKELNNNDRVVVLNAIVEYQFEWIEFETDNIQQLKAFCYIQHLLDGQQKKSLWNAKWWSTSKWWWRPKKESWKVGKQTKTTQTSKTTQNNLNNGEGEREWEWEMVNVSKIKYLDFIYLTEIELEKLNKKLWEKKTNELMENLNNYIWSKWIKYKSHYFTILNRSKNQTSTNFRPPWELSEAEKQRKLEEYRDKKRRELEREESKMKGQDWRSQVWI